MANVERKAGAEWEGDLGGGAGRVSLGSSGILQDSPVTWASRVERSDGKTSPEELIAAAHASCYAMALSVTLADKGNEPEHLSVDATCTFDDEALKVASVDLEVRGKVQGISGEEFQKIAEQAENLCPVSNALRGNVEIRLDAQVA